MTGLRYAGRLAFGRAPKKPVLVLGMDRPESLRPRART